MRSLADTKELRVIAKLRNNRLLTLREERGLTQKQLAERRVQLDPVVFDAVKVTVWQYACTRCGHKWQGRTDKDPMVCAKCKSPYWDKPRRNPRPTEHRRGKHAAKGSEPTMPAGIAAKEKS